MEAKEALAILQRHGFTGELMTVKRLKQFRNLIYPVSTWPQVIRNIMMNEYLVGDMDLTEEIYIPEVEFGIGGTKTIRVKIVPE